MWLNESVYKHWDIIYEIQSEKVFVLLFQTNNLINFHGFESTHTHTDYVHHVGSRQIEWRKISFFTWLVLINCPKLFMFFQIWLVIFLLRVSLLYFCKIQWIKLKILKSFYLFLLSFIPCRSYIIIKSLLTHFHAFSNSITLILAHLQPLRSNHKLPFFSL